MAFSRTMASLTLSQLVTSGPTTATREVVSATLGLASTSAACGWVLVSARMAAPRATSNMAGPPAE